MHVAEIYRYPVKSMLGETLQEADVGGNGIVGDRTWALKDERRGELTGAKRFAALMDFHASFISPPRAAAPSAPVRIQAGEAVMSSSDADINARLSELLNHPLSLWPLRPATDDAHYRRAPASADVGMDQLLREVFARTENEPIPDLGDFPEILTTHHSFPGTYFDAFPLLIMTRSALTELETRARDSGFTSNFDPRRFRPNLIIDTADRGFVEDGWIGQHLRLDEVVIKVEMGCPRCIMTTHGFADLPKDPKVMRALVQHNGGELGVYASVVQSGKVRAGARVERC